MVKQPRIINGLEVQVYKKTGLVFALLVFLGVGFAQAHGPTRQKVIIKEQVAAAPQTVWELVKNFHDMSWHPAVIDTVGEGGNRIGAPGC